MMYVSAWLTSDQWLSCFIQPFSTRTLLFSLGSACKKILNHFFADDSACRGVPAKAMKVLERREASLGLLSYYRGRENA
jgi:hypothetical protein